MSDQPRYATLRDYLRVVRERRWLILIVTVAFAAAAVAFSLLQTPTYQGQTSLRFVDTANDADLVGATAIPSSTPEQLAAQSAEAITRPGVLADVRRRLHTRQTVDQLQGEVSAQPEALTNFVVITTTSPNPRFAAKLANAFAREVVSVTTRAERRRFGQLARAMRTSYSAQRHHTSAFSREMFAERVSRVTALSRSAAPVQVAKAASVPDSPSSPRTLRNGAIGALVGLVVGLLLAFLRDSLDRRLRGAQGIQEELALPLLGHVPARAMGKAVISNNGHKTMTEQDLESFRIMRANLAFLDREHPARSVVVTSGLPGEGKSTVSSALAATAALSGRRTLLVECDLRRPRIAERFGLADGPGLSDYLAGRARPGQVLRRVQLGPEDGASENGNGASSAGASDGAKDESDAEGAGDAAEAAEAAANGNGASDGASATAPRLMCIPAGTPVERPGELLGSERFHRFLTEVGEDYEFVVLDSSPLLSVADTLELVPQVDAVILCVRASQTTQEQARAAKAAIDRLPGKPAALVVTGIKPGDAEAYGYYSYAQ